MIWKDRIAAEFKAAGIDADYIPLAVDTKAYRPTFTAKVEGREVTGREFLNLPDNAFVVGIFSTLDVMLGVSMEKALASIQLSENVTDALLHHQGALGPFLQLVEACENSDFENLEMLAMALQLDGAEVSEAHLQALAWTETLGI